LLSLTRVFAFLPVAHKWQSPAADPETAPPAGRRSLRPVLCLR
jgi:hypothetical protein